MHPIQYQLSTTEEIEHIAGKFCIEFGDDENGVIPDAEYDLLFDHLGAVLGKHGSFTEKSGESADFKGYRYVDQIPWISIVPNEEKVLPSLALKAALEAIQSAHRPLAVSFDYYPECLIVLPERRVFSSFPLDALADELCNEDAPHD